MRHRTELLKKWFLRNPFPKPHLIEGWANEKRKKTGRLRRKNLMHTCQLKRNTSVNFPFFLPTSKEYLFVLCIIERMMMKMNWRRKSTSVDRVYERLNCSVNPWKEWEYECDGKIINIVKIWWLSSFVCLSSDVEWLHGSRKETHFMDYVFQSEREKLELQETDFSCIREVQRAQGKMSAACLNFPFDVFLVFGSSSYICVCVFELLP